MTTIKGDAKLATRMLGWADGLQAKIDHASRSMTQNPTPKRNREYQSRMHDARNMERTQRALRALAEAHNSGEVPELLADLKTKDDIARLVRKHVTGAGGYYSVIEADDYSVTTPQARMLQDISDVPSEQRAERERLRKIESAEAEIKLMTIPGYFPTPANVVAVMLNRARIADGMKVLEPSAGNGNIADAIRKAHPGATVDVVEMVMRLRDVLRLKGYALVADDFTQVSAAEFGLYDRVVMNPPFERQQDIDHVRRAFTLLQPDGILVSVMAPGFEFRNDRKSTEFREWLQTVGAEWEDLPDGSFKASGTGVGTRLLTISK